MASAKKEAEIKLGPIDRYINLKGLNRERKLARNEYKTNSTAFQNAYNDLLSDIANRRSSTRVDFNKGRATVGENAYLQNRQISVSIICDIKYRDIAKLIIEKYQYLSFIYVDDSWYLEC